MWNEKCDDTKISLLKSDALRPKWRKGWFNACNDGQFRPLPRTAEPSIPLMITLLCFYKRLRHSLSGNICSTNFTSFNSLSAGECKHVLRGLRSDSVIGRYHSYIASSYITIENWTPLPDLDINALSSWISTWKEKSALIETRVTVDCSTSPVCCRLLHRACKRTRVRVCTSGERWRLKTWLVPCSIFAGVKSYYDLPCQIPLEANKTE